MFKIAPSGIHVEVVEKSHQRPTIVQITGTRRVQVSSLVLKPGRCGQPCCLYHYAASCITTTSHPHSFFSARLSRFKLCFSSFWRLSRARRPCISVPSSPLAHGLDRARCNPRVCALCVCVIIVFNGMYLGLYIYSTHNLDSSQRVNSQL